MVPARARIVVIGAGFSGLAVAVRLRQAGIRDFVVLEQAPGVGGAWHHNTYPGCRCDIPSHLYSLSFAPNPQWTHTYSGQAEIRAYLEGLVERFGLAAHLHTGVAVDGAAWIEAERCWRVRAGGGTVDAQVLIAATGPLHEPVVPAVPGLERFAGHTMHSARWDHGYDLTGKRVVSIGTGASAIQYVPAIQPRVERLYVVQRTAPWVMPHRNRAISDRERWLYRHLPFAQRLVRGAVYAGREALVVGFVKRPGLLGRLEAVSRAHMRRHIADAGLRERLTPDYALGCKRLLPSNEWYPALARPNVEVLTGALREVRRHSVVDAGGVEHPADAIIFGTGFRATDARFSEAVVGRGGLSLAAVWQGSPTAYLGASVPGFPNFFKLLGPNTGLGHGSMVYMIESQVEHVLRAIRRLGADERAVLEVEPGAYDRYNAEIDARMRGTVWDTGGCTSFYIDANGRNAGLWPDWTWRFRRRARATGAYTVRAGPHPLSGVGARPGPSDRPGRR
ncbi:NAD(P)/FAD-dependent oxidoreductase [Dactylosporangium vinaceum]|uniref:Flavin-containing monooxygenase n=1 Tax=Dactylosporangium vinaceum TaxID=53362 RepID=A0ABV5M9Z0_9ACTN|nr:NAD(P)/FAD-dependent oxidoreductase [Dactylosporangium vinaceum]UAB93137.1 NAD(P)/FAD-dependent oxidoreductase [Dactylosporangium vinaceum]